MLLWIGQELRRFGYNILHVLVLGLYSAWYRRQFCQQAFVLLLLGQLLLDGLLFASHTATQLPLGGWLPMGCALWLGLNVSLGCWLQHIAYWELYFSQWLSVVVCSVWLQWLGAPLGPLVPLQAWSSVVVLELATFLLGVVGLSSGYMARDMHRGAQWTLRFEVGLLWRWFTGRAQWQQSLAAVIGVGLGTTALLVVTAVLNGYQQDIVERILATNAHLMVQKYGTDFGEHEKVIQLATDDPRVAASSAFVFNEAMLSVGDMATSVVVKGIDANRAAGVTSLASILVAPQHPPEPVLPKLLHPNHGDNTPRILVGHILAEQMHLQLGSQVQLTSFGNTSKGMLDFLPTHQTAVVAGIVRAGMYEFDAHLVYVALPFAAQFFGMRPGEVTGVELRLHRRFDSQAVATQLLAALGYYPYRTLDWQDLNSGLFLALKLQKVVAFLVISLLCVVASFNVASTLFRLVIEKSADIAILMTAGASPARMMRLFVLYGLSAGSLGIGSGMGLGLLICLVLQTLHIDLAADVYMVGHLNVVVAPSEMLWVALTTLLICFLATLYPAYHATRHGIVRLLQV